MMYVNVLCVYVWCMMYTSVCIARICVPQYVGVLSVVKRHGVGALMCSGKRKKELALPHPD